MNLATFLVDVATLHVLELQVTGDSTVNQEFHQLACVCVCVCVTRQQPLVENFHLHVMVYVFNVTRVSGQPFEGYRISSSNRD